MSTVAAVNRATIVLSVAAAATAILTVYFLVGTPTERRVVQRQTQMVVRSLLGGFSLPADTAQAIQGSVPAPDPALDAAAARNNSQVRTRALLAVGALLFVATVVARRMAGPFFPGVVKASIISGLLAACTELAFLLIVAQWYDSVDANNVRLQIVQQLEQDLQS